MGRSSKLHRRPVSKRLAYEKVKIQEMTLPIQKLRTILQRLHSRLLINVQPFLVQPSQGLQWTFRPKQSQKFNMFEGLTLSSLIFHHMVGCP